MLGESAQCKLSSKIKIWFTLQLFILQEIYPYVLVLACQHEVGCKVYRSTEWSTERQTKNVTFNRLLTKPLEHSTQVFIPTLHNANHNEHYTNCKCWPKFYMWLTFWKCWRWTWLSRMMTTILSQLNTTVWLWLCEGPNNDCIMPTKREHILQSFVLRTCQET